MACIGHVGFAYPESCIRFWEDAVHLGTWTLSERTWIVCRWDHNAISRWNPMSVPKIALLS